MAKDEQAKNVAMTLIFLNQDSLFSFNIKKSIKRFSIKAIIIIISLKKMNKSRKWIQANENGIIGKTVFFLLLEIIYCHCIPEINEEIIAP